MKIGGIGVIAAYKVRSKDPEIRQRAQDGGATTSILIAGMRNGLIDAALVVDRDDEWRTSVIIARDEDDILRCSGTKYVYTSTIPKLKEASQEDDINSIAFINVPCQVKAINNIMRAGGQMASKIGLNISLFCMHSFTYESLGKIAAEAGVKLNEVSKMDIKGKFIFYKDDGEAPHIPISKAEEYIRPPCRRCKDFISEHSDLAIGSIGTPRGWNTVLALTERGREFIEKALDEGLIEAEPLSEKGIKLVDKFIRRKREEAED